MKNLFNHFYINCFIYLMVLASWLLLTSSSDQFHFERETRTIAPLNFYQLKCQGPSGKRGVSVFADQTDTKMASRGLCLL